VGEYLIHYVEKKPYAAFIPRAGNSETVSADPKSEAPEAGIEVGTSPNGKGSVKDWSKAAADEYINLHRANIQGPNFQKQVGRVRVPRRAQSVLQSAATSNEASGEPLQELEVQGKAKLRNKLKGVGRHEDETFNRYMESGRLYYVRQQGRVKELEQVVKGSLAKVDSVIDRRLRLGLSPS
jgi:hypothetical protein